MTTASLQPLPLDNTIVQAMRDRYGVRVFVLRLHRNGGFGTPAYGSGAIVVIHDVASIHGLTVQRSWWETLWTRHGFHKRDWHAVEAALAEIGVRFAKASRLRRDGTFQEFVREVRTAPNEHPWHLLMTPDRTPTPDCPRRAVGTNVRTAGISRHRIGAGTSTRKSRPSFARCGRRISTSATRMTEMTSGYFRRCCGNGATDINAGSISGRAAGGPCGGSPWPSARLSSRFLVRTRTNG